MIKSVRFANGFSNKNLKRIAFILTDEIEQYLSNNQFLNLMFFLTIKMCHQGTFLFCLIIL